MTASLHSLVPLSVSVGAAGGVLAGPVVRWMPETASLLHTAEPGPCQAELWGTDLSFHVLHHVVHVEVFGPRLVGKGVARRFRWAPRAQTTAAVRLDRMVPTFDGQLEVLDGPRGCVLSLSGAYDPPGGGLGSLVDAAGMHVVAEHTVTDLAATISRRIVEALVRDGLEVEWDLEEQPRTAGLRR